MVDLKVNDITDKVIEYEESEPESEPESESEDKEEKPSTEPSKDAIYNSEALLEKLEDIAWPKKIDWTQKLTINHQQGDKIDVNDDLARELAFYTQALDSTRVALSKFEKLGMPFLRPQDYYAEMVKSDSHMLKIKDKLLFEKKKIEEAEERRKMRENKKIAKQVQAEKLREREKRKKDEIESVKKWRKQREREGFVKGEKGNEVFGFEDGEDEVYDKVRKKRPGVAPGDRSGGKNKGMSKAREKRDKKFGFGGRKALKKQNTAETTNDFRGFNKGEMGGNKKQKRF
ncbi:rRNA processing protein EBP2 [Rhynchospora pubera]|uniref:rRNA processing protein EBP2 n=1 Tax=Rhynchospora pubera TaxID=906938 RepID=A0AAV8EK85_9POAL|nr:rRNA processing protein EBP2 [Rhynchospora pubera]